MRIKRKIIEIDEERCSGCGKCVTACAEGAIRIIEGKARLVSEVFCDGLGACLGLCPEGALTITERESEEFDSVAVEDHVRKEKLSAEPVAACGCPSQNIEIFPSLLLEGCKKPGGDGEEVPSALTHWPVQIGLIPSTAPFLKNADLLIAADCTVLAYAGFHRDLLPGKVVMMGCPKLDDAEEHMMRFAQIFRDSNIKTITVVDMEVSCCSKLLMLVRKALSLSGMAIPMEEIVISRRGRLVQKRTVA